MEPSTFLLEIPPDAAYVATARLFSAGVGRQLGCEDDAVEDLKLAVSEACAAALATRDKTGTPLRIRLSLQADGLKVDIEDGGGPPGGELAVVLGDGLVQGLFPETSTPSNDHGRRDISFKVSLGAAGSS